MKSLKFEGGQEITYADLAKAIRRRGELGQSAMYNITTGLYCAAGIARLECGLDPSHPTAEYSLDNGYYITHSNDAFEGTPAVRAEYMADLLEREAV